MYSFNTYWTSKMIIDFLQRTVLIHSYLYYVLDSPVRSDKWYDDVCRQLIKEQSMKSERYIRDRTQYGYVFYDFDGSTGFDLFDRLNESDKEYIKTLSLNCLKGR